MKLCSACLLGIKCRYDGVSKLNEKVIKLSVKETLIPVCPEQLGGLTTPRKSAEIVNNSVITEDGYDVTDQFISGAEEVLKIAKLYNIKSAILKQRSPSCGCGQIYDGNFTKTVIAGEGVTTKLLKDNGIEVFSEDEI